MSLSKNINSYATVEEADAYFSDRLDVAAWDAADAPMKAKALVTASLLLNDKQWIGLASNESQTLAFPRQGVYLEPITGYKVSMDPVPRRIIEASLELAYHLLNNDGLQDSTGNVRSISIDSIKIDSITAPPVTPLVVYRKIEPLLNPKTSGNSWWRCN